MLIKRRFPGSEDLHRAILAELQGRLTSGGGSVRGDRSKRRAYDFFTWEDFPPAEIIRQRFLLTLDQGLGWALGAWVNVNRRGDSNTLHNHAGGRAINEPVWSGIYYVADGGGSAATVFPGEPRVFPDPGLMVIFPSSAYHAVEPHDGASDRVTIAINAFPRVLPGKPGERRVKVGGLDLGVSGERAGERSGGL